MIVIAWIALSISLMNIGLIFWKDELMKSMMDDIHWWFSGKWNSGYFLHIRWNLNYIWKRLTFRKVCYYCGMVGHHKMSCSKFKQEPGPRIKGLTLANTELPRCPISGCDNYAIFPITYNGNRMMVCFDHTHLAGIHTITCACDDCAAD